jgi:hypothetical protein
MLITQARTQIAARAKRSVKPWQYRYPRVLLQDVVEIRVRFFHWPIALSFSLLPL